MFLYRKKTNLKFLLIFILVVILLEVSGCSIKKEMIWNAKKYTCENVAGTDNNLICCISPNEELLEPNSQKVVFERLEMLLIKNGFLCQLEQNVKGNSKLKCKHKKSYINYFSYSEKSSRLTTKVKFRPSKPCVLLNKYMLMYNREFEAVQLSCDKGFLSFVSNTILPKSGLSGEELQTYILGFTGELKKSMKKTGIWDLLED